MRPVTRYGGFDILRATAMLLGIGYHATFAYVPDIGRWYVVQDVSTDSVFAALGSVLHAVRMQAFFVVAGFFAHLVAQRGDLGHYLQDRGRRLLLPLLGAAPLVVAFDVGAQAWASHHGLLAADYRGHTDALIRPLYLWFLEYALLFSVMCWPLRGLLRETSAVRAPEALLGLTAVTAGSQRWLGEATPAFSFWPQAASLAHFGPFFLVGWLLWGVRGQLVTFRRCAWLGPVGLALACWVYGRPLQWAPTGQWLGAFSTWAMVLGALALAARLTRAPPPWVRFLVAASYWVYLVHYPLVVMGHLLLARAAWPAWVKFTLVVLGASAGSLLSYALVIRNSAVGRWLSPSSRLIRREVSVRSRGA